jgi:tRNA (guanosine-2'-O-)-methyltransferase
MSDLQDQQILQHLGEFVSDSKKQLIDRILEFRTRHITVVLEDIFQPHNASAVIRSCDCFGIQDLHIIENRNEYILNPNVTQGSSKWVDLIRHNKPEEDNTRHCLQALKDQGYKLIATAPHEQGLDIHDLPLDQKFALVFGTELEGLSPQALKACDQTVRLPMYGFTESFNISVSVALCLHTVSINCIKPRCHGSWMLQRDNR